MYHQWKQRGYATPVDTLMDCKVLDKKAYEDWRFGRVPYLERVCTVNLKKLSFILHQMRVYAGRSGWKESFCFYKQWGMKGNSRKLQFSKSGNENIERQYATHFVDKEKVQQIKMETVSKTAV